MFEKEDLKKAVKLKKKQLEDKELIKKQSWNITELKNLQQKKNCLIFQ